MKALGWVWLGWTKVLLVFFYWISSVVVLFVFLANIKSYWVDFLPSSWLGLRLAVIGLIRRKEAIHWVVGATKPWDAGGAADRFRQIASRSSARDGIVGCVRSGVPLGFRPRPPQRIIERNAAAPPLERVVEIIVVALILIPIWVIIIERFQLVVSMSLPEFDLLVESYHVWLITGDNRPMVSVPFLSTFQCVTTLALILIRNWSPTEQRQLLLNAETR